MDALRELLHHSGAADPVLELKTPNWRFIGMAMKSDKGVCRYIPTFNVKICMGIGEVSQFGIGRQNLFSHILTFQRFRIVDICALTIASPMIIYRKCLSVRRQNA
jgi:hypothetical protein